MSPPLDALRVFPSIDALLEASIQEIAALLRRAGQDNRLHIALAGGSTPQPVYEGLAEQPGIDWEHIEVWFGDERTVAPDHEDCNFRMASEALLDLVPIPDSNIHRMRGEIDPNEAAERYEHALRQRLDGTPLPRLDLVILGMGDDGHTASLFPGTPALEVTDRLAVASYVPQLGTTRLTLTYPVLNAARHVLFIVAGESKAPALREVFTVSEDEAPPAARVQPARGHLQWFVDRDAAREVKEHDR